MSFRVLIIIMIAVLPACRGKSVNKVNHSQPATNNEDLKKELDEFDTLLKETKEQISKFFDNSDYLDEHKIADLVASYLDTDPNYSFERFQANLLINTNMLSRLDTYLEIISSEYLHIKDNLSQSKVDRFKERFCTYNSDMAAQLEIVAHQDGPFDDVFSRDTHKMWKKYNHSFCTDRD